MQGYDSIDYASLTDVGMLRSHNQDAHSSLLATDAESWQKRGHVFLVADGMGGHAVGELASEMAVNTIPHTYHKHASVSGVSALRRAFAEANASIHGKGQANAEFQGMGTTSTALVLRPEGAWIGHVGDSRAYRIRNGVIEQLSFDHSLVWEMAKREGVDPEQLHGVRSNVIVRSLGPEALVQMDLEGPHPIQSGDMYLLCSDGLSGQVSDAEIGAICMVLPPAEACHFLIDLANLRGGPDNITVVIVKVGALGTQGGDTPAPKGLIQRLPWPLTVLIAGLLLAASAGYLALNGFREIGLPLFLLAALAVLGGVIGLALHYRDEHARLAKEMPSRKLRVYRRANSPIDVQLIEKLSSAVQSLHTQVQAKSWACDDQALEQHKTRAAALRQKNELKEACTEYCRALLVLTESVKSHRVRGESFQPVWDKK